jgi:hypothetical protein
MVQCGRTSIIGPDELMAEIKKLAAAVTAFLEDALRKRVSQRRRTDRHKQVILKRYGKRGLLPGVDLDDTAST